MTQTHGATSAADRTFTRITVVTPIRRLNVAVPDDMSCAELVRVVIAEGAVAPGERVVLEHPARGVLHPEITPADLQLLDGECLTVRPLTEADRPRPVDDVAESVADRSDAPSGWTMAATHTTFAALLGFWCAAAAWMSALERPLDTRPLVLLVSLLVLAAAQLIASRSGRRRDGLVLSAFFVPTAAYSAWVLAETRLPGFVDHVAAALVGAALAVSVVRLVDPTRARQGRSVLLGVSAAAPAVAVARFAPAWMGPAETAALVAVVTAVGVGWVTHAAASTSGLLRLDTDAAEGMPIDAQEVEVGVDRATADITALLLGLSVTGAAAVGVLLVQGLWPLLTGLVLALVLVCRSRSYRRAAHVAVLLCPPVVGVALAALFASATAPTALLAPVVFAGAIPLALLAFYVARDVQEARVKVWLDRLEVVALIALVPLVFAVFDVYARIYHHFQ